MHSISSYPGSLAGYGDGSMAHTGSRSLQQESVTASRNQSMDLSLKTHEGDVVTINAASFSELDSYIYNQTGRMTTGGTSTTSQMSYRTMTLETGSSFTFSVKGNLSEQELDDIEQLVASLDKVMGEMVSGDMDGAVETALGMTDYDTVSSFSADLSAQNSYSMATEVVRESYTTDQERESAGPFFFSGFPGIERILQTMIEVMDETDREVQEKFTPRFQPLPNFQQPIDQLFAEHLKNFDSLSSNPSIQTDKKENLKYEMITDLRQRMQLLFDRKTIE